MGGILIFFFNRKLCYRKISLVVDCVSSRSWNFVRCAALVPECICFILLRIDTRIPVCSFVQDLQTDKGTSNVIKEKVNIRNTSYVFGRMFFHNFRISMYLHLLCIYLYTYIQKIHFFFVFFFNFILQVSVFLNLTVSFLNLIIF